MDTSRALTDSEQVIKEEFLAAFLGGPDGDGEGRGDRPEACRIVGCTMGAVDRWLRDDPAFSAEMAQANEQLNQSVRAVAYRAAVSGIDMKTTRWWLERRDPEFKPKSEVDARVTAPLTNERRQRILDRELEEREKDGAAE